MSEQRSVIGRDASEVERRGEDLPYSEGVTWNDLLFTAGQIGSVNPLSTDFGVQARQALESLRLVLSQAGASFASVLRLECFLLDRKHFDEWNDIFRETFPSQPPARSTLMADFAVEGLLIEIQAVAGVAPKS